MSEKRRIAADVYASTGNASEAARSAEVNRSTITRWLRDSEFQRLVAEAQDDEASGDVSEQATRNLSDLLPQAVSVIEKALGGDKSLVQSARVALDVMKTAAQLSPKKGLDDTPPLDSLIKELDARDKRK